MTELSFWRGKRVLLTGHTGFKGSWLALWLQRLGAKLTGYALEPPTHPSLFELAGVAEGMTSVLGDVRDYRHVAAVVRDVRPEIVIHMAAQSLVKQSYADPVATYATNVMGTVHVLEAIRCVGGVRAALIVTSDKCYENREWVWGYRENEAMGGYDPYSNSKGCAELVTSAYRDSFFSSRRGAEDQPAVASARAGNVIGGGDWAQNRLVPDLLRGFADGQPVTIRAPNAVRPWQHVLEPLSGYLLLTQRLYERGNDFAGAWNFGPHDADTRSVRWLADRLRDHWGEGARWGVDGAAHPHEAQLLRLDCTKARVQLQWSPRWDLDRVLQRCVVWYKRYLAAADATDIRRAVYDDLELYEQDGKMETTSEAESAPAVPVVGTDLQRA